jgi:hypothetical protein
VYDGTLVVGYLAGGKPEVFCVKLVLSATLVYHKSHMDAALINPVLLVIILKVLHTKTFVTDKAVLSAEGKI